MVFRWSQDKCYYLYIKKFWSKKFKYYRKIMYISLTYIQAKYCFVTHKLIAHILNL